MVAVVKELAAVDFQSIDDSGGIAAGHPLHQLVLAHRHNGEPTVLDGFVDGRVLRLQVYQRPLGYIKAFCHFREGLTLHRQRLQDGEVVFYRA